MKVPASIRHLYEDQKAVNDRLRGVVDQRIRSLKDARWHYESRVKELASFALKIESGRFDAPQALEDFFACTIVVANTAEIIQAETLVRSTFAVRERRPPNSTRTRKASFAFPFDDLRLYVFIPDDPAAPPTDLVGIVFEVQIKTFLQHAWTVATHDLLYKTDDANWSKERIGFQIKAMLEHAEVSIETADSLAASGALGMEDAVTGKIKKAIALVKSQWAPDELPTNVRHLAMNITDLLGALELGIGRLREILEMGKADRSGAHPSNLSPYATIVQYLLKLEPAKMQSLLQNAGGRLRVLLPAEIELPLAIASTPLPNAILVPAGRVESKRVTNRV